MASWLTKWTTISVRRLDERSSVRSVNGEVSKAKMVYDGASGHLLQILIFCLYSWQMPSCVLCVLFGWTRDRETKNRGGGQ